MQNNTALVYLGRIHGVHGICGWVKIHSDCRPRTAIFNYSTFIAQRGQRSSPTTLKLVNGRQQGKGLVAKFDGIDDRDSACALNGISLYVPRSALPAPAADEFYWTDLIGLNVVNRSGDALGTVSDLFETGANDVLVVRAQNGTELLIPFVVPNYILAVDFARQQIKVDWLREWSSGD